MNTFVMLLLLIIVWGLVGLVLFSKDLFGVDFIGWLANLIRASRQKKRVAVPVSASASVRTVVPETKIAAEFPAIEKEEPEDEDKMENVRIFKKQVRADVSFYESLPEKLKSEFNSYFVNEGKTKLVPELTFRISGNNDGFFEKVFNYIFKFRKLISLELLVRLNDELLKLSGADAEVQTLLSEAAIRVAYARRKDPEFMAQAEKWARIDVKRHQTLLNTKGKNVYSFTRLAIILEKKGSFKEALTIVEDALKRQLQENTKTGFAGRKARIVKQLEK